MTIKLLPLGGLGEIGMNCLVVERGGDALLVDCGVRFPGPEAHGVDLILPDFGPLRARAGALRGLVLTHGHDDHIGAVPYLLRELPLPVYGSRLTLALLRPRLLELGVTAELHELTPRQPIRLGDFEIEPIAVAHSVPDACALAIRTPEGTIVHTGDFKVDHAPIDGRVTDLARFAALGDEGVLCLLSDSTNADVPGACPGEASVAPGLWAAVTGAKGRVAVALFASHLHRVQQLLVLADAERRKVALVGRSLTQNVALAQELGALRVPPGILVSPEAARGLPRKDLLIIATGGQGEPRSGLVRIAFGTHPTLSLDEGDRVILSSSFIPGNELAIGALQNALARRGIDVLAEPLHPVHASGHAYAEDLRLVLRLTRPRGFVPVHGEARHLRRHRELALASGVAPERAIVAYDGDLLEVDEAGPRVVERVPLGHFFVDRWGGGDVPEDVVRDRRLIAETGIVTVVITMDRSNGTLLRPPEILAKGIRPPDPKAFWREAQRLVLEELEKMPPMLRMDGPAVEEVAARAVRRHCKKTLERKPVVMPVLVGL